MGEDPDRDRRAAPGARRNVKPSQRARLRRRAAHATTHRDARMHAAIATAPASDRESRPARRRCERAGVSGARAGRRCGRAGRRCRPAGERVAGRVHRASAPRIACSGTCAVSSAASSVAGRRARAGWAAGPAGRGARAARCSQLAQRRLLRSDGSWRATSSSRPDGCGASASSILRPRSHRAGGGGQHPRDVRGLGQRDLVGLAGERAAVDDGQRVAPRARGRAAARRRRARSRRRAAGRSRAPAARRRWWRAAARAGRPAASVLGDLAQRPWRLDAGVVRQIRRGRSAGVGDEHRLASLAACCGERDQVGEGAGARAAAQPADRQQRPAAHAGADAGASWSSDARCRAGRCSARTVSREARSRGGSSRRSCAGSLTLIGRARVGWLVAVRAGAALGERGDRGPHVAVVLGDLGVADRRPRSGRR